MTSPMALGGIAPATGPAGLDMLGASSSAPASGLNANGTPATAGIDPLVMPFAGVLARVVSFQASAEAKAGLEPTAMVQAALASLDAALGDAVPVADAGTSAIRALIEQVTRQSSATAPSGTISTTERATPPAGSTPLEASSPLTAPTPPVVPSPPVAPLPPAASASLVDSATQSLGAAAMIAPPVATITTTPALVSRPRRDSVDTPDDETPTARAEADADGSMATMSRAPGFAAHAPIAADPSAVVREAAVLDPAFRARLDRVIERMQDEFGHKVTIVETVRSQVRQDALYEQGRTAPGQVVTWTRASRHAEGFAADVMIDGGYENPVAFERLQRIANEEGLHTLGARDPGHLELRIPQAGGFTAKIASAVPRSTVLRAPGTPLPSADTLTERAGSDAMARIARVARVAEVAVTAGVARIAAVARVAIPGASAASTAQGVPTITAGAPSASTNAASASPNAASSGPNAAGAGPNAAASSINAAATAAPTTPMPDQPPTAAPKGERASTSGAELPAVAVTSGDAATKSSARERGTNAESRAPRRPSDIAPSAAEATAVPITPSLRGVSGIAPTSAAVGPDQAARVSQIDALNEQVAAQPVSSMVLNVDDGSGGTDRIRVDVRGTSVASTIDVHDRQVASELSARTGELSRALEAHGLAADGVRVRAVAQPAAADALRATSGGDSTSPRSMAGALAADASNPSRRERDESRDPRAGWTQQEQDSHRQRSRREREDQQP